MIGRFKKGLLYSVVAISCRICAKRSTMEQDGVRSKGIVKWFDGTKGYGFIEPEDGGDDVFVHRSSVKAEDGFRTLDNDEPVEFVIFEAEDGRHQAFDVTRMSGSMPLTSSTPISSRICERSTVEQYGVRIKGTVKWYDEFKGYGFIIPEDGGDNVFVHRSSIKSESCCQWLADGELVEFVISEAEDGRLQAFNVTKPGGDCINGNKLTGTTRFKATWKWFDYRIPSCISLSSFSNRDEACTPLNNCHVIDLEIDEDNNKNNSVAINTPQAKKEIRDSDCYEIDPIEFTRKLRFSSADDVDVTILADKGELALRDFPHPRHLCGNYPFNQTRHEIHCSKCFCYLCEVAAPCSNWLFGGHCSVFSK